MKLTKTEEAALLKVYDTWWESYLNGDIETYDSFLDKDFRFVGSTGSEEFLNKKDTTAFFEATAEQFAGKAKVENVERTIEPLEGMVLITDLADTYVKDGDDWAYYARFRFTSLLRKTENGWRFFYQHFSTPDLMANDGETIGIDKVSAENLKLRAAIKRRTAELELKNRELEIEAALERIRAQVTAMSQSSDLLDIVVTMRAEFVKLGHEAHYFWHMMWLPDKFEKAMTSGDGIRIGTIMELPRDFHSHYEGMDEWENSEEPIMVLALETEMAVDYIDKMIRLGNFQQVDPNSPTLDDIRHIGGITFVMARTAHGEIGYSLPGVVKNPPEEDLKILERFAGVFDLAHKRFEDLRRGEQQFRETQIELALEKVRARTMAMQKSEELAETAAVIFQQFNELGVSPERLNIGIVNEEERIIEFWSTEQGGKRINQLFKGSIDEPTTISKVYGAWKSGKESMVIDLSGHKLKDWLAYLTEEMGLPFKKELIHGSRYHSISFFTKGMILMSTPEPLSGETMSLLPRFTKVFDQTYTRFLDLQQAEEQAREAEIELALERVRARTMAMQKSEELADVATILFQQIGGLGISQWTCGFNIFETGDTHFTFYPGGPDGEILESCKVPLNEHPIFRQFVESKKRGDELLVYEKEGEIQADHYKYMHSLPGIGDMLQGMLDSGLEFPEFQIDHVANFAYGNIIFITYEHFPEMHNVFKRFAKVFEQTYTRFLDLQKAEKQAIEAKIETGLERVRAEMMAMHKSDELRQVVASVFTQLQVLGFEAPACSVVIYNEDLSAEHWFAGMGHDTYPKSYKIPYIENPYFTDLLDAWKAGSIYEEFSMVGDLKIAYAEWLLENSEFRLLPQEFKNEMINPDRLFLSDAFMRYGMLEIIGPEPLLDNKVDILKRFSKVFEQTYTRFLDLQKAEIQARTSQINLAVERVRARAMAMRDSSELLAVVSLLRDEMLGLKIAGVAAATIFLEEDDGHIRMTDLTSIESIEEGFTKTLDIKFKLNETDPNLFLRKIWDGKGEFFLVRQYEEDLVITLKWLRKHDPDYAIVVENFFKNIEWEYVVHPVVQLNNGKMTVDLLDQEPPPELESIMKKMASAFDLTYTRFLDLKKAEAQTREAQIEAALERVRSKTMAMHNSKDVEDIVVTLFDEVLKLGIDKSIRCGIGILEGTEKMKTWSANTDPNDEVALRVGLLGMDVHPMLVGLKKAWDKGEKGYSYEYTSEDVKIYYKALNDEPDYPFNADLRKLHKREFHKSFFFSSGILFSFSENPISDEASRILTRFADVFGQTYRRYLDLQMAEAQAREAQIEAALEKVRSRTMAMQSSTELVEAANLLFKQVRELGVNAWSAGYNVLSEDKTQSECWMSSEDQLQDPFPLFYTEEASFIEMGEFLKSDEDFFVQELKGKAIEQHYAYMKSLPELKETFKHLKDSGLTLPTYQINHLCKFKQGYLLFITYEPSPEAHDIFKRFTKVFEQTYTRFLDLQKAENQSKESKISLALERVRASSMAMHKSEQLAETAQTLFEQFDLLGVVPDRMSVAIINEEKRVFEFWATDQNGRLVNNVHDFSFDEPTCIAKAYKAWKGSKETCIVDLKGKELKNWIRYVKEEAKMEVDDSKFKGRRLQNFAFFSQGGLNLSSHLPISDDVRKLLQRFAKVFQHSYTRFLDLQKSEAQAREVIKHASVDRVRAEIASMRTSSDLKRITPLVWNELTTLGVPFIRCGVFIMDEDKQQVQTHLSTPNGKAIASFELSFENTDPLTELLPYWRKKEVYKDYWDKEAFVKSTKLLMERGAFKSSENFIPEHPPANLYLHFLPFAQGMLYVGSEISLTEDELSLAQNLADAFSTAYSRYEDFNNLELANKKIEKTLVDLKQTQTQLVQSEKMASLGELTAGIAHEIQNPLNFVNNFSEVSTELVDEMNDELEEGNLDFAKEIADDLKQNLDKINHHGKRAGEIVKGMLQHSRTSSGKKEATDINALVDEYLRLAYHGLRAKDKTFNSKMESQLDPDIPKLEVIPQDIGRVILNLITNAFYAVNERSKMGAENYDPKVEVITRRTKNAVEIVVRDNGSGMPEHIKEKVFQPFFTTKPTGQGTGLGLSLSYDIIKAHGGGVKLESKENEGTEFVIQIPLKS